MPLLLLLPLSAFLASADARIQRGTGSARGRTVNMFPVRIDRAAHDRETIRYPGPQRRLIMSTLPVLGLFINPNRKSVAATYDDLSAEVTKAFRKGEYEKVQSICHKLLSIDPDATFVWSLLGTSELILGSRNITMSGTMTEEQRGLLLDAIRHFDKSESLAKEKDPLTINNKANALGLLDRWEEAIENYEVAFQVSLDTRMKDFEVGANKSLSSS